MVLDLARLDRVGRIFGDDLVEIYRWISRDQSNKWQTSPHTLDTHCEKGLGDRLSSEKVCGARFQSPEASCHEE